MPNESLVRINLVSRLGSHLLLDLTDAVSKDFYIYLDLYTQWHITKNYFDRQLI